ncbi:MAG TPA: gliding motility-associated C-terminal domain-containing protein [Bacteroidales bacterium]|nr:gliding motility-associated C-terminal domain-containing protein [Bacteroidales bacterium]
MIFFLLTLLSTSSFAQKETYIWYFGKHAGLDFNQTPPTVLTNGALNQMEGCSSICNQAGQLLFYTDGMTVWNKNHVAMPNGTGLGGDSHSTNSGFIVKQPGNANIYYVFTVNSALSTHDLRYSVVDMSLNGALGGVTLKNVFLRTNMTEKICAVTHGNNQDVWVVTHERNSTNFVKYLVTATGISSEIVQSIGSLANTEPGSLRFSHCGDKLANANPVTYILDLFNFDRSTGIISNAQQIAFPAAVLWLEFSANSEYLYLSIGHPTSLYQLKVSTGVFSLISTPTIELGQLQLGPNGKIYVAEYYYPAPETYNPYNYIGVINYPELAGGACNFVQQGVNLNINGNSQSWRGLPSFVSSIIKYPFNLGPDTTICSGNSITFHAGVGYNSYLWQNGSTDSVFTASAPGMYAVTVTDKCDTYTDSVNLTIISDSQADLGNDTTICPNDNIMLDPGSGFISYLWQNGSTDSTLAVTVPGTYWCQVTTLCGLNSDTIIITQGPPPDINLGPDTSICEGASITIHAGSGYNSYLWQNGSTDSTYTVTIPGTYWCQVTTLCGVNADSIIITQGLQPVINLGPDTSICEGASITFHAGSGFNSYLWQNGSSDSVFVAAAAGIYAVTVTNNCGFDTDSVRIINIYPSPQPDLGNDTSFCTSVSITLDAGSGYGGYLWQNGTTDQTLPVNAPGTYSVTVTNSYGCHGSDSIQIGLESIPVVSLGNDRSLCDATSFVLDPGPGFNSYLWQDGSTEQTFEAISEGVYSVTVTNDCGSADTSVTINACPKCICDIPNAFTPNSDGVNDVLFVKGSGFTDLDYKIFNRLGEQVFFSNSIDVGWDGKWQGINQENEVFIYVIKAKCLNGENVFLKGNVTLLK